MATDPSTAVAPPTSLKLTGWCMIPLAAVAMVATLPGRTHGLGMITERLLADPHWEITRSDFGWINLWATLIGALFCFGIGPAIDRFGFRWTALAVMLPLGGVVIWMSKLTVGIWLFPALLLTRGLGQSALSVLSITLVGKWIAQRVTLAMGVFSVLLTFGFIGVALVAKPYELVSWRDVWSTIGYSVIGAGLLLGIALREPPSDHSVQKITEGNADPLDQPLSVALRTPLFWTASLSLSLFGLIVTGIALFNESILVDRGFEPSVYYDSLAVGAGVGLLGNLAAGTLGLRFSIPRMLCGALMLLAASLVWLTRLTTYADVMLYVVVSAGAGGALTVLSFSTWPEIFGRKHLGKIQGVAQMLTVVASAIGPLLFGVFRDQFDSYDPLLLILAAITLALGLVAWFTPLPDWVRSDLQHRELESS